MLKDFLYCIIVSSKLDELFTPKKAIAKVNKPLNTLNFVISNFLILDLEQALAFAPILLSIEELF